MQKSHSRNNWIFSAVAFSFCKTAFLCKGGNLIGYYCFSAALHFLFSFIISVYNHLLSSPHRTPAGADVRKNPERNLSYRKYLLRSYVLSRFPSDCWVLRPATTESPVPDKHPVPFENHPFASYFFHVFCDIWSFLKCTAPLFFEKMTLVPSIKLITFIFTLWGKYDIIR